MTRKYFRDRLRSLMKLDDPPHKLAQAFGLGVFIAFSPWLGLHILSALLFAWLFRLSKVVILTGSLVNNPWTIVPLYGFCLWFGMRITGSTAEIPPIDWKSAGFSDLFALLKPFLWPFVAGTLTAGAAAAFISYLLFFWAVVRYRKAGG